MATASPKKKAVLYARYSSDMQNVTSIEGQLLLCRKVAARNDLDVVGEFVDAAKSGLTEDARVGYQRLLNGVRKHDFDVIIVEHFDRLSRDPATIQRLKQVFEFNGVELMDQKGVYATATDISIASLYNTIYKPQLVSAQLPGPRLLSTCNLERALEVGLGRSHVPTSQNQFAFSPVKFGLAPLFFGVLGHGDRAVDHVERFVVPLKLGMCHGEI
jgi:hypothetical protein